MRILSSYIHHKRMIIDTTTATRTRRGGESNGRNNITTLVNTQAKRWHYRALL